MQKLTYILSFLLLSISDVSAFTANEIDISQFAIDLALVVGMVLTVLLSLFGYRFVMKVLGK